MRALVVVVVADAAAVIVASVLVDASSAVLVASSAVLVGKACYSPPAIAADDLRSHSQWRHSGQCFGFGCAAAALRPASSYE